MNSQYNIKNSPIWPLEVMFFLLEVNLEEEKKIIENHNSFGKTEEEILDFFASYLDYKNTLKKEVLPIYYEYPKLEIGFRLNKNDDHDQSELVRFITHIQIKHNKSLLNEDRAKIVEEAIIELLQDFFIDINDGVDDGAEIKSLSHLVALLENVDKTAEEKLQIISLYENRCEFMVELEEFMNRVIPIFKTHYSIISNDFNNTLEKLKEMEDLNSVLWEFFSQKPTDVERTNISVNIFAFNQLSTSFNGETLSHSIGIYFFPLKELKQKYSSFENALLDDLKAISDNTRLNIMYSLAKKPMYIQELAEELDLTPATISHHMNILTKNELISITIDMDKSKRIYYEINENKLRAISMAIEAIAKGKERDKDYGRTNQISIS